MKTENKTIIDVLKTELNARNNPADLKPGLVGVVTATEPVSVTLEEGKITLTEGEELFISEQFRLRCNLNKTSALSETVPNLLNSARSVTETHSYTGAPCGMPSAIGMLADAVALVDAELLSLKCTLKTGDYVLLASLEQTDRFLLVDKVI